MARLPRLYLPGCAQHIIQRGNNREACFYNESDYKAYLPFLKGAAVKSDMVIHAFVLMTNHVHLVVTLHDEMREDYLNNIREATNKSWALGDGRFKAGIEQKTGRRSTPTERGGDRKSKKYLESKNQ